MASRCASSAPFRAWNRPSSPGSAACTATPSSIRPSCSTKRLRLSAMPRLRFAGQITGCEGYVESAAIGLMAGRFAAAERLGEPMRPAAADHRARRAARPHHRRAYRDDRCRSALVPADERQLRPVPAAVRAPTAEPDGKRLRGPEKTLAKKRALTRARARRSRALDRRRGRTGRGGVTGSSFPRKREPIARGLEARADDVPAVAAMSRLT